MKGAVLIIFCVASVMLSVFFLFRARRLYRSGERAKRLLSAVQLFTAGLFISVLLLFLPIYYTSYNFGDSYHYVRPFLLALHNALRIFILDGDFDIIVTSVSDQNAILRVCFSAYAAVLYVVAPIMTFSNVLSMFKSIKGEAEFRWHKNKSHYILSELNPKSIALAKSIYERNPAAVIVFTDVFEQNEEGDYELLMQARDINAICLKKDITYLDIASKKGEIEIFLIGNNESENVSQAVKITAELNRKNTKHNVKVFVFSTKPSASYIIDSMRYDNLLAHASDNNYGKNCFKLRRIDEKQQLIWNIIPKMKLFEIADRNDKTLSVLIVGMGSYGMEFFKTLLWYCQIEGYKLQINALDKRKDSSDARDYMQMLLKRDCPELLQKNRSALQGEAYYDVEIFSGIDLMRADFEEMVLYDGADPERRMLAERLKKTNLAFVSLGDDDNNIEMAIHLRRLFDRINGLKAVEGIRWEDEPVDIYSVVYDDQKSAILGNEDADDETTDMLRNHQDISYHIHFIGGMSSQFDHANIYDEEIETKAFAHHVGWVDAEERIFNELSQQGKTANYTWSYLNEKTPSARVRARKKYEQYEYYRRSSIARELYHRQIKASPKLTAMMTCLKEGNQTCECENCLRRKRSEHMRWNAYIRVLGYTYNPAYKADRARQHNNLCEWAKLNEMEKWKD